MRRSIKKFHILSIYLLILCLPLIFLAPAEAGGPLTVIKGKAALWQQSATPIRYILDRGRLGPLSNFEAVSMLRRSFDTWDGVELSWLTFRDEGLLDEDTTDDNYEQVLTDYSGNIIPIIFDDRGDIIDDQYGLGSKQDVLGLTQNRIDTQSADIIGGVIIFNGYFFNKNNYTEEEIYSTILHEIGHICGMDHAQHSRHLAWDGVGSNDIHIPIMFPTATDDERLRQKLTFDDRLSIANLYPKSGLTGSTGKIAGEVKKDNQGKPGVNVIVRNLDDPIDSIMTIVTGNYAENGEFEIAGLPPGEYELAIESVDEFFTRGSSVGQYSEFADDLSFDHPVRPDFYNEGDAEEEARSRMAPISVRAGQTTSNIVVNAPELDLVDREKEARLLALGSYALAGAEGNRFSYFEYLLDLDGTEGKVFLDIEAEEAVEIIVEVKRESRPNIFAKKEIRERTDKLTVTIGEGGDTPLVDARYFFALGNGGSSPTNFILHPYTEDMLPTPTPTATPAITPTPTIPPIDFVADINGDGMVSSADVFAFAADWFQWIVEEPDSIRFDSDLDEDGLKIDAKDALRLIEAYPRNKKGMP